MYSREKIEYLDNLKIFFFFFFKYFGFHKIINRILSKRPTFILEDKKSSKNRKKKRMSV